MVKFMWMGSETLSHLGYSCELPPWGQIGTQSAPVFPSYTAEVSPDLFLFISAFLMSSLPSVFLALPFFFSVFFSGVDFKGVVFDASGGSRLKHPVGCRSLVNYSTESLSVKTSKLAHSINSQQSVQLTFRII